MYRALSSFSKRNALRIPGESNALGVRLTSCSDQTFGFPTLRWATLTSRSVHAHYPVHIAKAAFHNHPCHSISHCFHNSRPSNSQQSSLAEADPLLQNFYHQLEHGKPRDVWLAYVALRNAGQTAQLSDVDFLLVAQGQLSTAPKKRKPLRKSQSGMPGSSSTVAEQLDRPKKVAPEVGENAQPRTTGTALCRKFQTVAEAIDPVMKDRVRMVCQDWLSEAKLGWVIPQLKSHNRSPYDTICVEPDSEIISAPTQTTESVDLKPIFEMYMEIGDSDELQRMFRLAVAHGDIPTYAEYGNIVLQAFVHSGDTQGMLEFFRTLQNLGQPDAIDSRSTDWVVTALTDAYQLEQVKEFYSQVIQPDSNLPCPTSQGYSRMVHTFAEAKDYPFVQTLYADMLRLNVALDDTLLSDLLTAFGVLRDSRSILSALRQPRVGGRKINQHIYGSAVNALTECRAFEDIATLEDELFEQGKPLNEFALNSLINAAFAQGNPKHAMELYQILAERINQHDLFPKPMQPSIRTYGIVVFGLCNNDRLPDAERVFRELLKGKIPPTTSIYNKLIGTFLQQENYDKVIEWFQHMVEREVDVDNHTAHLVMTAYLACGDPEEATNIFQIFRDRGLVPNVYTYTTALRAFTQAGHMGRALSLFEEMTTAGISPNAFTYACMIKGYAGTGDADGVGLMHRLFSVDIHNEPDLALYNTLLDAYNHVDSSLDAFQIWELLVLHNFPIDNVTVSVAIDACGFAVGYLHRISEILDYASRQGLPLNTNNFTSIVEAYLRQGMVEPAYRVITKDMVEANVKPDAKLFTSFFTLLRRARGLDILESFDQFVEAQHPDLVDTWQEIKTTV
ncbi:hypothetical protein IWQ62_001366 [Dispira parvispora]|uniref:Pentatricopeptide repeat-containing protein n=1 Tax=Dispira parvispora TaxID=1520584 RepID=A0A9W8AW90_9FUNG|nr:hypothetical protein IWQ62_001366 [Dispira parvispora]